MRKYEREGKQIKPTAILTADWHLRDTQPVCRTDNFWEAQWKKVQFILNLQNEHKCPIIHAGDFFHTWKTSPYLLSKTMEHMNSKYPFLTVYGNHDLPQHNLELAHKSGLHTLCMAGKLITLPGGHWGDIPAEVPVHQGVAVCHIFTYADKVSWPGCTAPSAKQILKKYPQYKLIVTGDNHTPFVVQYKDRLLVNPGSITRQTTDQQEHRPKVFLWYEETNDVVVMYLPIEKGVVTREHMAEKEARDERMEAFISKLKEEWDTTISFEQNMKEFLATNKLRKSVVALIHKAMDMEDC